MPSVKRDKNNYRVFDENDIAWINSLSCLKNCDMTINEMKEYLQLCLKGEETIPERQRILEKKLKEYNIRLLAEDCGLNYGRTVEFYSETGDYVIKSVGKPVKTI